jgi:hypothetical protein
MNTKLQQVLTSPMRTILAVRAAFDYCENVEDIEKVIKKVPPKFGRFKLLNVYENENYFIVQNLFEKDGEIHSQVVSHDFYNIKEDYYYDFRGR